MGRKQRAQYLIYIVLAVVAVLLYLRLQGPVEGFEEKQKPKGIILEIIGGLGNQLYIYSAGKLMQKATGTQIFMVSPKDLESFKNTHSKMDYRPVLFKDVTPIERDAPQFSDKIDARVQGNFWHPWTPDSIPSTDKYVFIPDQWYQNYPSIESVIPEVRGSVLHTLQGLYADVKVDSGTAFIHVRRGDYTQSGNDVYLLEMDYYNKALKALDNEKITSYYIFSDDIHWCKQQKWDTDKNIKYIDEPNELKTLYMMSQCKGGAVISNSTFSTWGAILGAQEAGSTIVYPSKWLYGASTDFPSDWIRI
jgi:hypothetical protein